MCPIALDPKALKNSDWPSALKQQIMDYYLLDFSGWKDPDALKAQFKRLYEGILLNYPAAPP